MKKIVVILFFTLVLIGSAFASAELTSVMKQKSAAQRNSSQQGDTMLITERYGNRIIEVDSSGTVVWEKTGLNIPTDAERLGNGNTLIAEEGNNRVIEVDSSGNIVWDYNGLNGPQDVERLEKGNTLISDTYSNRVIEVDNGSSVVWEKAGLYAPIDAERLENGNTLIVEFYIDRVIEVNSGGTIVWETSVPTPVDAERLGNGNTLITDCYDGQRVIEVDSSGNLVWEYTSSNDLFDAERLANGNTLITEFFSESRVIEVDSSGTIVWEKTGLNTPVDAERLSLQPDLSCGGRLSWTDVSPGSTVTGYFYVENIGDPTSLLDWEIESKPEWGTWTITPEEGYDLTPEHEPYVVEVSVEAPDKKNSEFTGEVKIVNSENSSDYCTIDASLSTPKNKPFDFQFNLLSWLFERFPHAFPILRQLLGL